MSAQYNGIYKQHPVTATNDTQEIYGEDEATRFINTAPVFQQAKSAEELGVTITPFKTFIPSTIEPLIEAIGQATTVDNATILYNLTIELIEKSGYPRGNRNGWKALADESLCVVKDRYSKAVYDLVHNKRFTL